MSRPIIGIPCRETRLADRPIYFNNQSYCRALTAAGATPVLIPLDADEQGLLALADRLDGLLLAGGGDVQPALYHEDLHPRSDLLDPMQDSVESILIQRFIGADRPVLGICRGVQILNVACGGSLVQDLPTQWETKLDHDSHGRPRGFRAHTVAIKPGTRLGKIMGEQPLWVNSFHHQAVRSVAPDFLVSARAPDQVVEAIELPGKRFVLGVQCHPEELWEQEPRLAALFRAFVGASAEESEPSASLIPESLQRSLPEHGQRAP